MQPQEPVPAKLLCGVLYSDRDKVNQAYEMLESRWGSLDWRSKEFPFDITDYYVKEMGSPIYRIFLSFRELINPREIVQIKLECNKIEDVLAANGQRRVNLDPGYMDYDKVVLASAKYAGHKIYLDDGIYADVTLMYRKGKYHPTMWSFPDFRSDCYQGIFMYIRTLYKKQLRNVSINS